MIEVMNLFLMLDSMKFKIIIVLSLLLCSCYETGKIDNQQGEVIISITPFGETGRCVYTTRGNLTAFIIRPVMVIDSCGRYNIGDTLKVVKK